MNGLEALTRTASQKPTLMALKIQIKPRDVE